MQFGLSNAVCLGEKKPKQMEIQLGGLLGNVNVLILTRQSLLVKVEYLQNCLV